MAEQTPVSKRATNAGAERFLYEQIQVLDHGYVKLVDYMGDDATVVEAARHSYGKKTDRDDVKGNTRLINFLMKNHHSSPFEQPSLVFEIKAPIFVMRQFHRHRTAKLNEASARYMKLPEEVYIPSMDRVQAQSKSNKQGSEGELQPSVKTNYIQNLIDSSKYAHNAYEIAEGMGVANELARLSMPVNTYSVMVWQMDLSNLLKFLKLRTDSHAQWEIRQYADVIEGVVNEAFPIVYQAWLEHVKRAITLSRSEAWDLFDIIERTKSCKEVNANDLLALTEFQNKLKGSN